MAVAPYGSEFRINTTAAGNQDQGSVAALANGRFVVTWQDGGNIKAQIFNANGSKSGAEITITAISGTQQAPVVAGLNDGRFVVAWENQNPSFLVGDGSGSSIWARVYTGNGTPDTSINGGNAMLVNDVNTVGNQFDPAIAAHRDGGYIIAWTNDANGGGNLDIQGRLFSGPPAGSEFTLSDSSAQEKQPAIVGLSNGNYVVAYDFDSDIGAVIMSGTTTITGLLTPTPGVQSDPALAADNDGFELVWTHAPSAGGNQIRGRSYTNGGSGSGDFGVSPTGAINPKEAAIAFANGSAFSVWTDARSLGGDNSGTHIEGTGSLLANQGIKAGSQSQAAVATLRDGRVIVIWTDPGSDPTGGDDSGSSIRARIFDPRTKAVALAGSALDDDYVGTAFDDVMNGQGGKDRIEGAGGKDVIGGSADNDTILGGTGDDNLLGGDGIDLLWGGDGKDAVSGGAGADSFHFDVKASKKSNLDHITDFEPGVDTIVLDQSVFPKLKLGELKAKAFLAKKNADAAKDGKDRIVYDTKSGEAYWDKDGKGGAKAKLFAILDGSPDGVGAGDFLVVA